MRQSTLCDKMITNTLKIKAYDEKSMPISLSKTSNILKLKILFLMALGLSTSFTYANLFLGVEVMLVSSSGKTVMLDSGAYAGINLNDKAKFVLSKGTVDNPELKYVGSGEAIKVMPNYSYWYFSDISQESPVAKGQKLSYIQIEQALKGRRKIKLRHKRVIITDRMDLNSIKFVEENGVPRSLIAKEEEYQDGEEIYKNIRPIGSDIEAHTYDEFTTENKTKFVKQYMQDLETKHVKYTDKTPMLEKALDETNEAIFDGLVRGVTNKLNDQEYGLAGLYYDQKRDQEMPFLRNKISTLTVFDENYKKVTTKDMMSSQAAAKYRLHGKSWSADLNDEELRRYIIDNGISEEYRRQKLALDEKQGSELILRMGLGLEDNFSFGDINYQGRGYSFGLAYEYHLGRSLVMLERLTLELFLRQAIHYFVLGDSINGRFDEGSFGGAINYYFYGKPQSLDAYVYYLGVGMRRGNAAVTSERISKDYEYQLVSMPEYRLGMKYRFRSGDYHSHFVKIGMGVNLMLSIEAVRYSPTTILEDNLYGSVIEYDTKAYFGINMYF